MTQSLLDPIVNADPSSLFAQFYACCGRRQLSFQRCSDCRAWRHVPRNTCDQCGSTTWAWEPSTGRGTLFSWTVVHRALHPSLKDQVPYAVVLVETDETVRLISQLVDYKPSMRLSGGMSVEVVYQDVGPGLALPKFRLT